ncbi:Brp/Blh family beta-carotene 15,15'-dioxygenase [Rhodonellum sp.]|uniref:Brp/Blh family beta-carotene 15,15'-dioxygenase n=1 Tax=Rhodonellum sp. TaxID=2231180 RepID=UPI0027281679|nr:Brp/Blh family beta-carotene 15,15'-dioxygenase [Rhodonellum sp.]MDO9553075.1 Brp/Blh family beta-carotene 15,15'-dioxygenase [Rhodonellum sp.]
MKDIENLGKILGLLISILYLVFFQGNLTYQWVCFLLILVTIGIPHGAIDHLLERPRLDPKFLTFFILKYLLIIGSYLILWVFVPLFSLIAFILMSAYHFGQSHFIHSPIEKHKTFTYLAIGGFYLSVILWGDFEATSSIVGSVISLENFEIFGKYLIGSLFVLTGILIWINKKNTFWIWVTEMLVIGGVLFSLPLLLGFILYFGFWHALPSMAFEFKTLKIRLGISGFKPFIKMLLPFSTISILGIFLILWFVQGKMGQEQLILLFFVLVSLISAPHIWFMNRFIERSQN